MPEGELYGCTPTRAYARLLPPTGGPSQGPLVVDPLVSKGDAAVRGRFLTAFEATASEAKSLSSEAICPHEGCVDVGRVEEKEIRSLELIQSLIGLTLTSAPWRVGTRCRPLERLPNPTLTSLPRNRSNCLLFNGHDTAASNPAWVNVGSMLRQFRAKREGHERMPADRARARPSERLRGQDASLLHRTTVRHADWGGFARPDNSY